MPRGRQGFGTSFADCFCPAQAFRSLPSHPATNQAFYSCCHCFPSFQIKPSTSPSKAAPILWPRQAVAVSGSFWFSLFFQFHFSFTEVSLANKTVMYLKCTIWWLDKSNERISTTVTEQTHLTYSPFFFSFRENTSSLPLANFSYTIQGYQP